MMRLLEWMLPWLLRTFEYKEIGWKEIGEVFYRIQLFKCRWGNVYLHRCDAPNWHPQCHDHPWHFWALILAGGYWEQTDINRPNVWRAPGSLLYRTARFKHNVATEGPSWSLVVTSSKCREWGLLTCSP